MSEGGHDPHTPSVTIRDVAERANVALSSVSRVLSGHPDVSASMRTKVERAAAELGYEPDMLAQSLRKGSTMSVGFLLRDISNPLFADVARRCEHELRAAGYSMLIMSSDGDAAVEAQNLGVLRRRRVDGVIASLVSESEPATTSALGALTVPLVLLDREVSGLSGASAVLSDHYTGVRSATKALLAAGHRRIALVTGNPDVRSTRERLRAMEDALAEEGLAVDDDLVALGTFDGAFARSAVVNLLSRDDPPTAILAGGIGPTIGTVRALRQLRLGLGADVTVVALDEWPNFDVLAPPMWSVRRDSDELGRATADLMLDLLRGARPRVETIDTDFVQRG